MQHGGGVRERGIQQKVKAWVLHGVDQLRFEDMEKAVPKAGEALVSVRAAGVCGSDIPRIYRTGTHKFPLIPGHEFSGEVNKLGHQIARAAGRELSPDSLRQVRSVQEETV